MEARADYVIVGAFVLALVTGLVVAVLWVAHIQFGEQHRYYDIYFTGSVIGLVRGSSVLYNGVSIGSVHEISLDPANPQEVRVTIEVKGDTVVRSDVVASLELQGLTGGAVVEITGGSPGSPPLEVKDDERYPVIASRPSELQRLAENAPELLQKLSALADALGSLLDARNRAAVADTLQNLRQITGAAAGRAGDIDKALGDGAVVMQELRQNLAELQAMLKPGGQANTTLASISDMARKLGTIADHLDAMVQENRPALRGFTGRGLNELQQLLLQSRQLVADLTRLTEHLENDPSSLLYGDRQQGYRPR
jgi:phospholipid/cholesterol/gamma-HCH transport system substrate-binding protein